MYVFPLSSNDTVKSCTSQGVQGPFDFSGFAPSLGEFVVRIVDCELPNLSGMAIRLFVAPFDQEVSDSKTYFLGRKISEGNVWQAKGATILQCSRLYLIFFRR